MSTSKTCNRGCPLRPHISNDIFTCDYCLETGMGPRFSCAECKYNLHRDCALAEPVKTHSFLRGIFTLTKRKTMEVCAACGRPVQGFSYYCEANNQCLHPCCAYLPKKVEGEEGWLFLDDKVLSECDICDRDDPGWCYRTKTKDNYIHISCMIDETCKGAQNRMFANALNLRLEEVAYDETKRSQKFKMEMERASADVKLIKDNSNRLQVQVFDMAESSTNNRKGNKKTKKSKGFWRWVGYAVTYVAASVGISFASTSPSPRPLLLLEG